ncbi:MAG: hypothetical protein JSV19_04250 [Phycisphaerales bacterium]|nr:MAG: hypothetical protein JSV19_04250 [Phycisphaerales bacterium]
MNLMSQYLEKTLKSARTFLSRWNGTNAEMWELTTSHKALDVVIRRNYDSGNLVISCLDPVTIKGPVRWKECQLRVSTTTLDETGENGFSVADERAGFEVVCRGLEVAENVKL